MSISCNRACLQLVLVLPKLHRIAKDDQDMSAHDIAVKDPYSDLARLFAEVERGDLW